MTPLWPIHTWLHDQWLKSTPCACMHSLTPSQNSISACSSDNISTTLLTSNNNDYEWLGLSFDTNLSPWLLNSPALWHNMYRSLVTCDQQDHAALQVCNHAQVMLVIFGVLVYLWLYSAPSRVSHLGSSLVRLLYPAEDGKSTLSLISSSAVPLCPLWSRASL